MAFGPFKVSGILTNGSLVKGRFGLRNQRNQGHFSQLETLTFLTLQGLVWVPKLFKKPKGFPRVGLGFFRGPGWGPKGGLNLCGRFFHRVKVWILALGEPNPFLGF